MMHTLVRQADALHGADRRELLRRVHNLERHMRENKLRFTFTDALGRAQSNKADEVPRPCPVGHGGYEQHCHHTAR
jgi:hypothetical protein